MGIKFEIDHDQLLALDGEGLISEIWMKYLIDFYVYDRESLIGKLIEISTHLKTTLPKERHGEVDTAAAEFARMVLMNGYLPDNHLGKHDYLAYAACLKLAMPLFEAAIRVDAKRRGKLVIIRG